MPRARNASNTRRQTSAFGLDENGHVDAVTFQSVNFESYMQNPS